MTGADGLGDDGGKVKSDESESDNRSREPVSGDGLGGGIGSGRRRGSRRLSAQDPSDMGLAKDKASNAQRKPRIWRPKWTRRSKRRERRPSWRRRKQRTKRLERCWQEPSRHRR